MQRRSGERPWPKPGCDSGYQHDHVELWQEAVEGERPWPRTLSKRDAAAWVRSVRRFGLEARLSDIAREVGPALEGAPHSALCALLAPAPPQSAHFPHSMVPPSVRSLSHLLPDNSPLARWTCDSSHRAGASVDRPSGGMLVSCLVLALCRITTGQQRLACLRTCMPNDETLNHDALNHLPHGAGAPCGPASWRRASTGYADRR